MWYNNKKIQEAVIFAWEKHFNQMRDGGNPYFVHLDRVTRIVAQYTQDEDVLTASLLHDIIEDTTTAYGDIEYRFGKRVADIVLQLTNDYSDNLEFKLKLEATKKHARNITIKEAKLIKLADRLDNLRDCYNWKASRQARYIVNTRALLEGLGEISAEHISLANAVRAQCRMIADKNQQVKQIIQEQNMMQYIGNLFE